ncbi:MAG: hypothetical protein HKM04_09400 [Legionellales bacterium]|nr:hypothetical protein [Legionellales bacterium]
MRNQNRINPYAIFLTCVLLVAMGLASKGMLSPVVSVLLANHAIVPVLRLGVDISNSSTGQVLYGLFHTNPHDLAAHYALFLHQDVAHFPMSSWKIWATIFGRDLMPLLIPLALLVIGLIVSLIWLIWLFNKHYPPISDRQPDRSASC